MATLFGFFSKKFDERVHSEIEPCGLDERVLVMVAKWAFFMPFLEKTVFFQNSFISKNAIKCQIMPFWHFLCTELIFYGIFSSWVLGNHGTYIGSTILYTKEEAAEHPDDCAREKTQTTNYFKDDILSPAVILSFLLWTAAKIYCQNKNMGHAATLEKDVFSVKKQSMEENFS